VNFFFPLIYECIILVAYHYLCASQCLTWWPLVGRSVIRAVLLYVKVLVRNEPMGGRLHVDCHRKRPI